MNLLDNVSAMGGSAQDIAQRIVLEHFSANPLVSIESRQQSNDPFWEQPMGKPTGLWVSAKGEDDWLSWCKAEGFGIDRLFYRHTIKPREEANLLWVCGQSQLEAFDERYGVSSALFPGHVGRQRRCINWKHVAYHYDGIIIAPYVWELRLDGQISDWYYGWDCASGCIWNASAIEIESCTERLWT